MKKIFLILVIVLTTFATRAQYYKTYDWRQDSILIDVPESFQDQSLITLLRNTVYEYDYIGPSREFGLYYTNHEIRKVNNDDAVERSNRIYIPLANTVEIIDIKARTVLPTGEIVILDENNIKEIEDEDGGEGFKIFALEGVEVGSQVEFIYTKRMHPSYFGREYFQYKYPVLQGEFRLISPWNLEFDFRTYNTSHKIEELKDEKDNKNIYVVQFENMPLLREEPFGFYNSNRARIDYKLAYNAASGKSRLFTWANAADRIFYMLNDKDKSEEKDVLKLSKSIGIKNTWPLEQKIRHLEHYIKTNFYYDEFQNAENLSFITANKIINDRGAVRLYMHLFSIYEINYEIVLTTDRSNINFDPKFDNWNFLEAYLFYFPDLKKYLDPTNFGLRLGLIPPIHNDNHGLFIRAGVVQDEVIGFGEVRKINARSYQHNFDNLDMEVSFNDDFTTTNVKAVRNFKGITSTLYKAAYPQLDAEKQQLLLKDLIKFLATDAEIEDVKLRNTSFDYMSWDKPFEIEANFSATSYTDLAGPIILFKVGQLIGPQSELYQDDERITDVANDFNRGYLRKIKVNIPEGYFIENPDDLNMDFVVKNEEGKEIFVFKSGYKLEGNTLSITIDEFYDQISYPKEKFEDFRKVINAAADWNKIVLVMKKSNQ